MPMTIGLTLGHAQAAAVERAQRRLDRITGLTLGGGGDLVARLPGRFDGGFERGVGHGAISCGMNGLGGYNGRALCWQSRRGLARSRKD